MGKEYESATVADLTAMVSIALPRWGLSSRARAELINLSENATFLAREPGGGDIIIRVQRLGYSSREAILSELEWIKALSADGVVATARPLDSAGGSPLVELISPRGQRRLAVAFERLPGREPEVGQENLPYWFERIGGITARLHRHARSWRRPAGFTRRIWDYEGIIGPQAYWGRWQEAVDLRADEQAVVRRTLSRVRPLLEDYGVGGETFGVIHADLRTTNLLIDGDRLQVIDFDDMGFGWYLFDCAASLSFMEDTPAAPALLRSWIAGYEREAPLSGRERELLPTFSILRRLELMAWVASHSEVPFCRDLGAAFTRATVRLCEAYLDGSYLR